MSDVNWVERKAEFLKFIAALKVSTKDKGIISLGKTLYGSQRYLVDEIFDGLQNGVHHFVVLKGRQEGITTICLALDLYWHFCFGGVEGTLATDTDSNLEMFRTTINGYMASLPAAWKQTADPNNRNMIGFGNRSRMMYLVAGKRKNRGFGAGRALMYVHGTETGLWGEVDMASLEASFSRINPLRLYIFESTAYGYTLFYDMWEVAGNSTDRKQIFVGWYLVDSYRCEKGTPQYEVYWDGRLTDEEIVWVDEVKALYGIALDDEQIAWWRWTLNEACGGDLDEAFEKYPPTAEHAFRSTGSQFFNAQRLTDARKVVHRKPYDIKRFFFGGSFEETELIDCNEKTSTLKIWQMPQVRGQYVIGGDPAWGSSEWADRFAINVSRCWADGMEQVAEFCTADINTTQYAWALLYLAGAYGDKNLGSNIMINLEINGPGQAVWSEIQNLKRIAFLMKEKAALAQLLMNIENFLFRRIDSIKGGYNFHTKTSQQEKERYMNSMRDQHELGYLIINSVACLDEMKNVVRDEGNIGVPGRGKDDRVIAQALSTLAWKEFVQVRLIQAGITKAKQEKEATMPKEYIEAGRNVSNYLKTIGLRPRGFNVRAE